MMYAWLNEQDAQLSQRDRAAECVIVFAKTGTGRQYFTDIIGPLLGDLGATYDDHLRLIELSVN